jgi:cytidine deaminase
MENASYGLTMCAEVGALQAASTAGALHQVKRLAVVGGPITPRGAEEPRATPPCGRCRQLIAEAAQFSGSDLDVWYADLDLKTIRHARISELLPDSFSSGNLSLSQGWATISEQLRKRLRSSRKP